MAVNWGQTVPQKQNHIKTLRIRLKFCPSADTDCGCAKLSSLGLTEQGTFQEECGMLALKSLPGTRQTRPVWRRVMRHWGIQNSGGRSPRPRAKKAFCILQGDHQRNFSSIQFKLGCEGTRYASVTADRGLSLSAGAMHMPARPAPCRLFTGANQTASWSPSTLIRLLRVLLSALTLPQKTSLLLPSFLNF